jgi:hypothetical protein
MKYILIIIFIVFLLLGFLCLKKSCNKSNETFVNSVNPSIREEIFNIYNNDVNYIKKMIQIAKFIDETNRYPVYSDILYNTTSEISTDLKTNKVSDDRLLNLKMDENINVNGNMPDMSEYQIIKTIDLSTNNVTINNKLITNTLTTDNIDLSNNLIIKNAIISNDISGNKIYANQIMYKPSNNKDYTQLIAYLGIYEDKYNELVKKYNSLLGKKFNSIDNTSEKNNNVIPILDKNNISIDNLNIQNSATFDNLKSSDTKTDQLISNNINIDNYALYNYKSATDKTNTFMIGRTDVPNQIMPVMAISSNSANAFTIYNKTVESPFIATTSNVNASVLNSKYGTLGVNNIDRKDGLTIDNSVNQTLLTK